MKTNLSITGFNHIIDAIIRKEGGNYGVDKGEGDRSAGPGQGQALFPEQEKNLMKKCALYRGTKVGALVSEKVSKAFGLTFCKPK